MWFGYLKGHTLIDTVNNVSITFKKIYDVDTAYYAWTLSATITGASSYGKSKYQDFYKAVAAASDTSVHAAVTLADGETTTVTTAITDPDVYRVVTVKGNQASIEGDVVVTGTDWAGNIITDTIALDEANSVSGVKAFKTVTSILLPARTSEGDTVSLGCADVFGLTRPIAASTDIIYVGIAADDVNASTFTYEAASAASATYNTVTPTSSIIANDDITIDYYASAIHVLIWLKIHTHI